MLVLLLALMLSACATTQNHHDPIEPVNRVTDSINDGIDRITLKPMAQGYTAVVPKPMRTAVSNFYDNATYMNTVLNGFLQGKGEQGMRDLMRFLINTILGVGGLVDVASSMGFEQHNEDFGQTLATWGVAQGAYIIYPLLGPNSLRDTPDFITSTATNPLFWAGLALAPYITIPVSALNYIDKRARLLGASDMRDELALDPYVFTREAWKQNRDYLIHDGNPPARLDDENDDWDDGEDDDWGDDGGVAEDEALQKSHISNDSETITQHTDNKTPQLKTKISLASAPIADIELPQPDALTSDSAATADVYIIYLSSHYTEVEAAAEQGRIAKLGIPTTIVPFNVDQHVWYRLRASQYADKAEALMQLETLKSRTGLSDAWLEAGE